MQQKDYYQVLGVDRKATPEGVRQAYRKLAFQYHPDRNKGDASATEKMKQINEAYATLCDPAKRREYDALRERYGDLAYDRFRQAHSPEDIFRGSDIDQVFEEFARNFGFRGSDEIFREFYGPGFRTYEFRAPGQYGRVFIFHGQSGQPPAEEDEVSLPQEQLPAMPFPGFIGRLVKSVVEKVTGLQFPERGKDLQDVIKLTAERAEQGGEVEYAYRKSARPRNFMVRIPAGIRSGQRIRLRGMGVPGRGGGEPGDLYLRVRIKTSWWRRLKDLLKSWLSRLSGS